MTENAVDEDTSMNKALEKIVEEESDEGNNPKRGADQQQLKSQSSSSLSVLVGTVVASVLPRKGTETQEFLDSIKKANEVIKSIQSQVGNLTGTEPVLIEINKSPAAPDADYGKAGSSRV